MLNNTTHHQQQKRRVKVNVNELQVKEDRRFVIHRTFAVFKPRNVLSATCDKLGRTTLADLLSAARAPPLTGHIGRLDFETSGLILITSDSRLNAAVRRPVGGSLKF